MSRKLTTEEFIEKAKKIYGDRYDYSESIYIDRHTKLKIKCNQCGNIFFQAPSEHISHRFCGCPICAKKKNLTTEEFIEKAKKIYSDKYDYSKVEYKNYKTKVCIICHNHGEFFITPGNFLSGHGCPWCKYEKIGNLKRKTTEQFIKDARQVHNDRYDYSNVEYKNNSTKVCIICPEHGEFWQNPDKHLAGQGCPECAKQEKSQGEKRISEYLKLQNINFIHDKACLDFLGKMRPDFYLPDYNTIIEYDGRQHFKQSSGAWSTHTLEEIQLKDKEKNLLCQQNNVSVLRIPYTEYDNIENILKENLK